MRLTSRLSDVCTVGLARAERQLASQSSRRAGKRCGAVRGRRPLGSRPRSPSANAAPPAINQLRSDRRSASLIPSGSSRFSASTSAPLERFAPRAAIQREVRPCRGMTETSSARLARWPVPLCAKTKPVRRIRPVRGLAHGFFGAHDGAGRRAVNPLREGARTREPATQNPSTRATREPL